MGGTKRVSGVGWRRTPCGVALGDGTLCWPGAPSPEDTPDPKGPYPDGPEPSAVPRGPDVGCACDRDHIPVRFGAYRASPFMPAALTHSLAGEQSLSQSERTQQVIVMKIADDQVPEFESDLADLRLTALTEITEAGGVDADSLARVLAEHSPHDVPVSAFQSAI